MSDLSKLTATQLLEFHAHIIEELRVRGVIRTANNPTGDLAEYLFCKAFGWTQADNSAAHLDAVGSDGVRYQIKGRRLTRHNKSRLLSVIRGFDGEHFDVLAGVLFKEDYRIMRAALIPRTVVGERATYDAHINGHKFTLRDNVWELPDVQDVTAMLKAVAL